jgi:GH24 family phage-related lysozyme (muramidase)
MDSYLDLAVTHTRQFEGCVPWMYLDTVSRVTTGVGLMLPNAEAACALPFTMAARPATHDEIAADYARVLKMAPGHAAATYRMANSPILPGEAIDAHLRNALAGVDAALHAVLPVWPTIPDSSKIALLDMGYNLGAHGLIHGYPKLMDAVRQGHWADAATLCDRHGPGPARNLWTRQQFLSSVAGEIKAEAESLAQRLARLGRTLLHKLGIGSR